MPYKLNSLTGKFDFYQDEALSVKYNNTNSGLTATNVQDAINELNTSTIYPIGTTQTFLKSNSYVPATGLAVVINSLRGYHISIDKNVTIKDLRVRFSAGAVGNSVYGIYNVDSNGYPTNLIYSTTAFDNNLTSQQVYTQDLSITKGNYFVAYNSNSAPTAFAYNAEHLYNPILGTQTTLSSSSYNAGLGVAYTYTGTLPATFPAGAGGLGGVNHIAVIFRV